MAKKAKKTKTRILADKIKKLTGEDLIYINTSVYRLIDMGLAKTREEALKELLALAKDNQ